ncbi:ATP adenylyltransferase C-terminal [Penicillium lagena]|uniref:ATP adenylyltransferase C-terminal n=1 Tax=Penicillium lagena TaxID=94218 RepID=UPI0025401FA5|nr:ATP adenylyltransferase C-terminal [Penicillium lagena]KAJ5601544.1 ATP adenylyltransferase C-terminal [Penicillium lagena]
MSRRPACETCRKSKLACDHGLPVCSRCSSSGAICIYRTAPFKRRRVDSPAKSGSAEIPDQKRVKKLTRPYSLHSRDSSPSLGARRPPYPNPGFLGSSSHAAIFKHITPDGDHGSTAHVSDLACSATQPQVTGDNHLLSQGADILKQIVTSYPLTAMKDLVLFWLVKGANLALAEPFVAQCAESVSHLFTTQDENWNLVYARRLLQNTARPLVFDADSDLHSFSAQFLAHNSRWETIAIFFAAVSRATIDISFFPSLYATEEEQYPLRRLAMKLCDCALEISLSLDCLNDLQLIVQYENFIVHSYVDGDQSYHTWRKLGDVISSTFALGYHENLETKPGIPPFLIELRKTAFARIYSADKNIAIFLGRPPRMNKRFCHFQIPSCRTVIDDPTETHHDINHWEPDSQAGYRADTRWSALCAFLKEEIWELLQDKHHASCSQRASEIQDQAKAQWQALPAHFRLEGSLKQCTHTPFERDFLAGVRLQHLHVLFLLRLLLLHSLTEPDMAIIETAEQMLALVVEIILLRDQLTNSGTGLIWKVSIYLVFWILPCILIELQVAHYGLPAAGIILLSMLNLHSMSQSGISRTKTLQGLSVFVAEVQIGTIVRPGDPNYALLSKATQTIQRFLDSFQSDPTPHQQHQKQYQHSYPRDVAPHHDEASDDWAAFLEQDTWDFEAGFWQSLADHPSLLAMDPTVPSS